MKRPSLRSAQLMKHKLREWITGMLLAAIVWLHRDSNYIKHLRREVPRWFDQCGPNKWIAEGAEQLLAVLSCHGHSGTSVGFALRFFNSMARFKPWGPLTGDDGEWNDIGDGLLQNRRCSEVFKENNQAYWAFGRVFEDSEGVRVTNSQSRVNIEFPWSMPESPEIIRR